MNHIKRPPAVWLTQVLLLIFTLLMLLLFLLDVAMLLTQRAELSSLFAVLVVCVIMFAILLLFATSFWGLARAKAYGRWLGVSSMVLVWGLIIFGQLSRPSGPFRYYEYDNRAQVVGAVFAQLLLHALFLTLIVRLAFARKVSEFFHQRATQQIVGPERGEPLS